MLNRRTLLAAPALLPPALLPRAARAQGDWPLRPLTMMIPFVAGDQGEIVRAWSEGRLAHPLFAMPGCRGWRRMRGRGRCGRGFMNNPTFGR